MSYLWAYGSAYRTHLGHNMESFEEYVLPHSLFQSVKIFSSIHHIEIVYSKIVKGPYEDML